MSHNVSVGFTSHTVIMHVYSYKEQCQTVREKICSGYQAADCHHQPREECVEVPVEQCQDTPREVCHHTPGNICQGGEGSGDSMLASHSKVLFQC